MQGVWKLVISLSHRGSVEELLPRRSHAYAYAISTLTCVLFVYGCYQERLKNFVLALLFRNSSQHETVCDSSRIVTGRASCDELTRGSMKCVRREQLDVATILVLVTYDYINSLVI